jgi:glycosyltransferase involved in cell wall biosynthesis
MILENENIICFASAPWHSATWVNCQHLMSRLARGNRVLYVEPFSLRLPSATRSDLSKVASRIKGWLRGVVPVGENLWILSPLMIPLHRFRAVRALNRFILKRSLKRVQGMFALSNPILWIFLPTGADLVGEFGEKLVVYHCVDQYSANPGVDRESIDILERRLLATAGIVLTTSPLLYESKRRLNRNTHFLPNVADSAHFMKALDDAVEIPGDLEGIPGPRAGFIGAISGYKIDCELLAEAADRLAHVSFVLIGPVGGGDPDTDISSLEKRRNIFILGARSLDRLPAYLKGFDVCLIPFRMNETTRHVFPMKFFEYLSAGKPVVSTRLPSLEEYAGLCYLASEAGTFISSIEQALAEDSSANREARILLASENSWERRIETLSELIIETLDSG